MFFSQDNPILLELHPFSVAIKYIVESSITSSTQLLCRSLEAPLYISKGGIAFPIADT
jgi:hypothetical protein